MHRVTPTIRTWATAALLLVITAGCTDGQLVDAGGERGQGGLAFVLLAFFFLLFIAALFYMDRVRQRRRGDETE
jgi:cbb3-type cytochrome oxidase subunit 3